jgi:hypothetical protein
MILQYCSDLHLEFPQNEAYIKATPIQPTGDILIFGGRHHTFHEDRPAEGLF